MLQLRSTRLCREYRGTLELRPTQRLQTAVSRLPALLARSRLAAREGQDRENATTYSCCVEYLCTVKMQDILSAVAFLLCRKRNLLSHVRQQKCLFLKELQDLVETDVCILFILKKYTVHVKKDKSAFDKMFYHQKAGLRVPLPLATRFPSVTVFCTHCAKLQ